MSRNATRKVWVVQADWSDYDEGAGWVESIWTAKKHAETEAERLNAIEARRHIRNRNTSYEVVPVKLNTQDGRIIE